MKGSTVRFIARALWIIPALLVLLTAHQAITAYDIRETLRNGEQSTAEVTEFDRTDRSEVTYAYVSLRVELPDGRVIEQNEMSLPYSLVPYVQNREEVDVVVRPGARQEIVIAEIGESHWRVAAINAGMSFIGFIMAAAGIFLWNRFLASRGDPADHPLEARHDTE